MLLAAVSASLLACGIPEEEHQSALDKIKSLKAEMAQAKKTCDETISDLDTKNKELTGENSVMKAKLVSLGQDLSKVKTQAGAYLQVNGGSLIGRYGPDARAVAHRMLTDGLADYISSDYHARGLVGTPDYRHVIEVRGGQEQASLLLEVNPQRMLHEELPLPIPPLPKPGGLWRRMRRLFR